MNQATEEPGAAIIDVTDGTFVADVVEESSTRPVVVDFWASWCAPCRTLGPILEKLADENGGSFRLAKLDVDANPGVSAHFMVQGIPAVKAFVNGELVDEFVGSMPEPMVREWLAPLLPTETDRVVADAKQEVAAGDVESAERDFREALAADANNRDAAIGLAIILFERGDLEGARAMAEPQAPDPEAERILARVRVAEWAHEAGPGTLMSARRLAAGGKWREALDGMLGAMQDDPEDARSSMLDAFQVLGNDSDLTREYRGKLAAALF
jgi:putative thioredoxin